MAGRRTNLALLTLLVAAIATGFGAFAAGTPRGRWVVITHGAVGIAMVALAPWKSVIARSGLRRRRAGRGWSLALTSLVLLALAAGFMHAAGVRVVALGITAMQVHVGAALTAVPVALWHVFARPARPRRTDLSRRTALRTGALLGGAGMAWLGLESVWGLAGVQGARRRFTGSHEVDGPLVTQWLLDPVPRIDAARWSLHAAGRTWTLAELDRFDDAVTAVLDCTGGWYAHTAWRGVHLDRLLADPRGAQSVLVRSVTGYTRVFPIAEASHLLLATRIGDEPLAAGNGYPARLVAPGRRGFWWVKWVEGIELGDRPWWVQPPFPLQ